MRCASAARPPRWPTFLANTDGWEPPRIDADLVVQRHCHHQAVVGFDTEADLLQRTGAHVEILDSGCCGMAGSFGYEDHKYDVSVACGAATAWRKKR